MEDLLACSHFQQGVLNVYKCTMLLCIPQIILLEGTQLLTTCTHRRMGIGNKAQPRISLIYLMNSTFYQYPNVAMYYEHPQIT